MLPLFPEGLGHESPSIRYDTIAVNLQSIEHPLIPVPSPHPEGRREKAQQSGEPPLLSSTGEGVGVRVFLI